MRLNYSNIDDGIDTAKRSYVDYDHFDEVSERELALAQELNKVVEELENLRHETEDLRAENVHLAQERDTLLSNLHNQSQDSKTGEQPRGDVERRLKQMDNERMKFQEENSKLLLAKRTLEAQLEDLKYMMGQSGDQDNKLELIMNERNYFENQLRQARSIQVNLEQELRQKADERAQLVSNYEIKISALQNDITILKSQKDGDQLRQSHNMVRYQSENESLLSEINGLKSINKNLEAQIVSLRNENLSIDDNVRLKLAEAETVKRNTLSLLEKEKKASESLRNILNEQTEEFSAKEAGKFFKKIFS